MLSITTAALIFLLQAQRHAPSPTFETLSQQAAQARDANQMEQALALYDRALKLKPDWDEGLWNAGSIAYDHDQFAECAAHFRRLTELKPDLAPAWTMSGLCEYHLRNIPAALNSLNHAERLGFQEPAELSRAARLHLALLLTKTGSFEKAITTLTELTRIDHKTPETSVAVGIAGLRQPWFPSEVPEADRKLVSELGDAMSSAMELDPKTATEKFTALAAAYPDQPNVHFRFGAFLMLQEPDRGIAEIRKALELDPSHVPALVGLTMIYLKRDDPKSALEFARKAVSIAPNDFAVHVALGRALQASEDLPGAASEFEAAVKLAPESPDAHFNLATVYARLGRSTDAARQREEFSRLRKIADARH